MTSVQAKAATISPEIRAHPEVGLLDALDESGTPHIEVHEETNAELAFPAGFHHAPVATVIINGDIGSSYWIGLGIALRRLSAEGMAIAA